MTLVMTEAVVLHHFDYLESSRILRLVTRDHGVQSVLARGARRSKSRFGPSLDVFASGVAQFTARPGRDLHNLAGFDLTRSRMGLARDLDRFAAASALAELVLAFAQADPHDEVFDVLTESLDALAAAEPGTAADIGLASAWRLIAALGFGPAIDACHVCGAPIPPDESAAFSLAGGGVVCARCRTAVSVSRTLPADARRTMSRWIAGDAAPLPGLAERRAHIRLVREFLQYHLAEGRELRALAAWEASLRRRP
jgi:DNA repair protein RecO (recombination protein O)